MISNDSEINGYDHVEQVFASFSISDFTCDPDDITQMLSIEPTATSRRGAIIRNKKTGEALGLVKRNRWTLVSRGVDSKDANVHLRWLIARVALHGNVLEQVDGAGLFSVIYKSSYLYAGTGPVIASNICASIANLHAELGFDIYCTSSHVGDNSD